MRSTSIAILGLIGTLILSACSSSTNESAASGPNKTVPGNTNAVLVSNTSEVATALPVDANTAAFTSGNRTGPPANSVTGRTFNKSGESISPAEAIEIARKSAKPAPENSTFYSYLLDAGYEVRTFNSHPQLLKVEKKTANDGTQTVKVFLRGGKVIELAGERIPQIASAPAQVILDLAGVPRPEQPAPANPGPEKKSGE